MNLSPLSPTKTFNHELFTLVTRIGFSDASRLHCSKHHNRQGFSRTLSPSMFVSWNPRSQSHRMCAHGNRQHFGTDGRGKFSLALQCVSDVVLSSLCITGRQFHAGWMLSPWTDTCSRYHVERISVVGSSFVWCSACCESATHRLPGVPGTVYRGC